MSIFRGEEDNRSPYKEEWQNESIEKNCYYVILKGGERIPISRTSYPKLKTLLGL